MRRKIEAVFFDLDGSTLIEGTLAKSFRSLVNHKKTSIGFSPPEEISLQ